MKIHKENINYTYDIIFDDHRIKGQKNEENL